MGEPTLQLLINLGDLAAVAWAGLALFGVPAFLFLRWRRRSPPPALTPLEQATLRSMANRLSSTRRRNAQLVQENEELAREVARLGRLKDKAQAEVGRLALEIEELKDQQLAQRDELIQRLRRCVCTVGPALADEMKENERG